MGKRMSLGRLQAMIAGEKTNAFPPADNVHDLGGAANRWSNVYTGDLHLENDRGSYTLVEELEYLSIRNNKTGKLYKFVLEEIEEEIEGGNE